MDPKRRQFLRRYFLTRAVQGFTAVGLAFVSWPFIKAWIPSFERDNSLEVGVGDLAPGEHMVVDWLGRRVFIQRRSREMVEYFDAAGLELKDPGSAESSQPAFATNAYRSLLPEYFVAFNNCTHLGCEVARAREQDPGVGFECPCHQSLYDLAGRVVKGAAAPTNLEIPKYTFVSRTTLRLVSEPEPELNS